MTVKKIIIFLDGETLSLSLEKVFQGKALYQTCPFSPLGYLCGPWCPLFGPIESNLYGRYPYALHLCHRIIYALELELPEGEKLLSLSSSDKSLDRNGLRDEEGVDL